MAVQIINKREYELYVKEEVSHISISNKMKGIIRKLVMQAFDDGVKMTQGSLVVPVND